MGACQSNKNKKLSPQLESELMEIFKKIDVDGSQSIDREETKKYWKSNFAKVNTDALFKAVDQDNNGSITHTEWLYFWQAVKNGGYSDKEIKEEINNLNEGESWVYFQKKNEQPENQ